MICCSIFYHYLAETNRFSVCSSIKAHLVSLNTEKLQKKNKSTEENRFHVREVKYLRKLHFITSKSKDNFHMLKFYRNERNREVKFVC